MKLHEKTYQWWTHVLESGQLNDRLVRLRRTELDGYARFMGMVERWKLTGLHKELILTIAEEEFAHAFMVRKVLTDRGVATIYDDWPFVADRRPEKERYWDEVSHGITDFQTACAAGAYGEMLALNRFRVIVAHPGTPEDVRTLCEKIIPDESNHAAELRALAGKEAMDFVRPFHVMGKKALGLVDVEDE